MRASIIHLDVERGLSQNEVNRIREVAQSGGILGFPTDTIYGLGCDAFNKRAIKRIYALKGRAPERPFSVHVAGIAEVKKYSATLTEQQRLMVEQLLPGPYTVLLKGSKAAPPLCVSREGKIGLRVPRSRSFRLVSEAAEGPLVGTSINRSDNPPLTQIDQIIEQFSEHVDLIITTDEWMTQESSSVIDITFDPPRVLRGRIPEGLLRQGRV